MENGNILRFADKKILYAYIVGTDVDFTPPQSKNMYIIDFCQCPYICNQHFYVGRILETWNKVRMNSTQEWDLSKFSAQMNLPLGSPSSSDLSDCTSLTNLPIIFTIFFSTVNMFSLSLKALCLAAQLDENMMCFSEVFWA